MKKNAKSTNLKGGNAEFPVSFNNQRSLLTLDIGDGLVASYPFSGDANDESGNGYDGVIYGDLISTSDRFGDSEAYEFNGVDTEIVIQTYSDSDLEMSSSDYTISAWIMPYSFDNSGRIFSKGSSGCKTGFMLRLTSSGYLLSEASGQGTGCVIVLTSDTVVSTYEWSHVVTVVDRDAGAKIYINGVLHGTSTVDTSDDSFSNDEDATIGYNSDGYFEYFHGKIDDVHIYNMALDAEDVSVLYYSESTSQPTQHPTNAPTQHPTNAPTQHPTNAPTQHPTHAPSSSPTALPTHAPSSSPTASPTHAPSYEPTSMLTSAPTHQPSHMPTASPTHAPSYEPTSMPTSAPTHQPSLECENNELCATQEQILPIGIKAYNPDETICIAIGGKLSVYHTDRYAVYDYQAHRPIDVHLMGFNQFKYKAIPKSCIFEEPSKIVNTYNTMISKQIIPNLHNEDVKKSICSFDQICIDSSRVLPFGWLKYNPVEKICIAIDGDIQLYNKVEQSIYNKETQKLINIDLGVYDPYYEELVPITCAGSVSYANEV